MSLEEACDGRGVFDGGEARDGWAIHREARDRREMKFPTAGHPPGDY